MKERILKSLKTMLEQIGPDSEISDKDLETFAEEISSSLKEKFESGFDNGYKTCEREADAFVCEKFELLIKSIIENNTKILDSYIDDFETETKRINDITLESLDEYASDKIETLRKAYEAKMISTERVEQLDRFLNTFIEETLDPSVIIDAEKLDRLSKFYGKVQEQVFVSNEMIQNRLTEKIDEAGGKVSELETSLNAALASKIALKEELITFKRDALIQEKLVDQPEYIVEFVKKQVADTDLDELNTAIDEAVVMAEDKVKENSATDTDGDSDIISESADGNPVNTGYDIMDTYAATASRAISKMRR